MTELILRLKKTFGIQGNDSADTETKKNHLVYRVMTELIRSRKQDLAYRIMIELIRRLKKTFGIQGNDRADTEPKRRFGIQDNDRADTETTKNIWYTG